MKPVTWVVGMLAIVLVSTAVGSTPGPASTNEYTACISAGGGINKVAIGSAPAAPCGAGQTQISWSEVGPQGPPGADGTQIFGTYDRHVLDDVPPFTSHASGVFVMTVPCDAGDLVTGGGFQGIGASGTSARALIASSFQVGNAWVTHWENPTSTPDNVRSFATCLDITP